MPSHSKKNRPRHMSAKKQRSFEAPMAAAKPVNAEQPAPVRSTEPVAPYQPRPMTATKPISRPVRPAVTTIPVNYDYVTTDLKRIGIVAVSMFVLLGILTVILH